MAYGYLGSKELEVSKTENHEVIPTPPNGWTLGFKLYKFSFLNKEICNVVINGNTELLLLPEQGWNMDRGDVPITSFIIKQKDVNYVWAGAY